MGRRRRALVTAAAGLFLAAPGDAAAAEIFAGSVDFKRFTCDGTKRTRVIGEPTLSLQRVRGGKQRRDIQLDANGRFRTEDPPGSGPVEATLRLESSRFSVRHRVGGREYAVPLGRVKAGAFEKLVVAQADDAGALNIFNVATHGVTVADRILRGRLGRFKVLWGPKSDLPEDRDVNGSFYRPREHTIRLDGEGPRRPGDEREPLAILHELGHHVLESHAGPRSGTRVEVHKLTDVFPGDRIAWSEGFAWFFAALALADEAPDYRCGPTFDLGASPPTPAPLGTDAEQQRQWNEVGVAGATWTLSAFHGKGDRTRGAIAIMGALKRFGHGGVDNLREARDAMIEAGLEKDTTTHREVSARLDLYNDIGWGFELAVERDELADTKYSAAHQSTHVRLLGAPYDSCESHYVGNEPIQLQGEFAAGFPATWTGEVGHHGGLDFTWQDDCLTAGDNALPDRENDVAGALAWLRYPYEDGGALRGKGVGVVVRFTCAPDPEPDADPCPEKARYRIRLIHGTLGLENLHVELPVNELKLLFVFRHDGFCEWVADVQPKPNCHI